MERRDRIAWYGTQGEVKIKDDSQISDVVPHCKTETQERGGRMGNECTDLIGEDAHRLGLRRMISRSSLGIP